MTYEEIRQAWNAQADENNQWNDLGEDEKVEWAARLGAEKERAARQAAQAEVAELKERIAHAGVEQRQALHDALQQEREACAQVCEEIGDKMGGSVGAYDSAASIRSRTT